VTFVNCRAEYSGLNDQGEKIGYYSNGNGFKLGGLSGVEDYEMSKKLHHKLTGCVAVGNNSNGFDRNNQCGTVTLTDCHAESNKKNNYHWPKTGAPSSLVKAGMITKGTPITYGITYIYNCTSKEGKNNLSGAVIDSASTGFSESEIKESLKQ